MKNRICWTENCNDLKTISVSYQTNRTGHLVLQAQGRTTVEKFLLLLAEAQVTTFLEVREVGKCIEFSSFQDSMKITVRLFSILSKILTRTNSALVLRHRASGSSQQHSRCSGGCRTRARGLGVFSDPWREAITKAALNTWYALTGNEFFSCISSSHQNFM